MSPFIGTPEENQFDVIRMMTGKLAVLSNECTSLAVIIEAEYFDKVVSIRVSFVAHLAHREDRGCLRWQMVVPRVHFWHNCFRARIDRSIPIFIEIDGISESPDCLYHTSRKYLSKHMDMMSKPTIQADVGKRGRFFVCRGNTQIFPEQNIEFSVTAWLAVLGKKPFEEES